MKSHSFADLRSVLSDIRHSGFALVCTMTLALSASCSSDDISTEETTTDNTSESSSATTAVSSLSAYTLNFIADGGSSTLFFTTSAAWTATASESWCTLSTTSGSSGRSSITVPTAASATTDERNAMITISVGRASAKVAVVQKPADALTITSAKIEMDADGGTAEIVATYTDALSYSIDENAKSWISVATRATSSSTLTITVAANTTTSKREGIITLTNGTLSETVIVYQSALNPEIVLTTNSYTVAGSGETITVELKTNVDYPVELPSVSWVTASKSRATSTYTLYYTISRNPTGDTRSATITFRSEAYSIAETVTITQEADDTIEDGDYLLIQSATEGDGINLVFIGEGFVASEHVSSDGSSDDAYLAYMKEGMEETFRLEPMTSFRKYFNVWVVRAISPGCDFDDTSTLAIGKESSKAFAYAAKIDGITTPDVVVLYNTTQQIGTSSTLMYEDWSTIVWLLRPVGVVLTHEIVGHGLGHLADEYTTRSGSFSNSSSYMYVTQTSYIEKRWYLNVDVTSSTTDVRWAHFLSNSDYYGVEDLGVYEGAFLYTKDCYRSSNDSMMKTNLEFWNAPSREALYRNILIRAYASSDWTYNREDFLAFDKGVQRSYEPVVSRSVNSTTWQCEECAPEMVKGSWRDYLVE